MSPKSHIHGLENSRALRIRLLRLETDRLDMDRDHAKIENISDNSKIKYLKEVIMKINVTNA